MPPRGTKLPPRPTKPVFPKVAPEQRAIVVTETCAQFAEAVYALGLDPFTAYRAVSSEQAREMRARWEGRGIPSYVVPLATVAGVLAGARCPDGETED